MASTKSQYNIDENSNGRNFEFGNWNLFVIWDLTFGT
jgi:hypothetical protein